MTIYILFFYFHTDNPIIRKIILKIYRFDFSHTTKLFSYNKILNKILSHFGVYLNKKDIKENHSKISLKKIYILYNMFYISTLRNVLSI